MLAATTTITSGVIRIRPTISKLLIALQVVGVREFLLKENLKVADHRQKGDEYYGS